MVMASQEVGVDFRRYRDWLGVVEEVLTIALNGACATRIVYGANITFKRFQMYAPLLVERGLLTAENNREGTVYRTTGRGREFLSLMRKVRGLLEAPLEGLPRRLSGMFP